MGVFIHRVFRFEEEPRLKLYMGGWGNYGTLVSASLKGRSHNSSIYPYDEYRYDASLIGNSWGAGVVGGIEYTIASILTAYIETGLDYFIIKSSERTGTIDTYFVHNDSSGNQVADFVSSDYTNKQKWSDGRNIPIPLDFGGVFIRFGIRTGLGF